MVCVQAALPALFEGASDKVRLSAALTASRHLGGSRRLAAPDYLAVAAAIERSAAVLHYDRQFEPLCDALGIESIWLADPGSLY